MRYKSLRTVVLGLPLMLPLVCLFLIRTAGTYAANVNVDIVGGAGRTYGWWGDTVEWLDPPPVIDPIHASSSVNSAYFYGTTDTNLSTETISTFSSTNSAAIPDDGAVGKASGVSIFNTADDVFTLTGPAVGTPVDITANLIISGTLYSDNYSHWGWTSSSAHAYGGLKNGTSYGGIPVLFDVYATGLTPVNLTIPLQLQVIAGVGFPLSYDFMTQIQGVDGHEAWADFASTGRLSFDLPAGTIITSEGGFYVPEPATLGLLLLGSLALLRRRRSG